jgi:hypothetical protein
MWNSWNYFGGTGGTLECDSETTDIISNLGLETNKNIPNMFMIKCRV